MLNQSKGKMKRMNLKTWIIGVIAMIILSGVQVNAQRGRGYGPGRGMEESYERGFERGSGPLNRMEVLLDLSAEQKEQMEKLHLDVQKQILPIRNKIREKDAQLSTMISEGSNMAEIDQLVGEIGNLRTEIQKLRIDTHLKVRELLTDEQKVKFDNHFANRFSLGGPGMGPYGRHGKGWR
jgi:Spy/CpxP family protein refolding chaperone